MVTGYNVDAKHNGRVYHVQTEDRGRDKPVIETLIYTGGTIIHQLKISYEDQNGDDVYDKKAIKAMLDSQHERMMKAVEVGVFDPDRKPFGEEFLTDRTLDECIIDFLTEQTADQHLVVSVTSQSPFSLGEKGSVVVRATHDDTQQPVSGVSINSRLMFSDGGADPVPQLTTDESGEAKIEFDVPADAAMNVILVVQAHSDVGEYELTKSIC